MSKAQANDVKMAYNENVRRLPMIQSSDITRILLALVLAAVPAATLAQAFPAKPVRLILPFPPGGPTDLLGRTLAQKLSEQMGQQVVPENRPGAGGNVGLEVAAKSPPDGYSLVLTSSVIASAPALYSKLNYKQSDLAPISLIAEVRNILLVHPAVLAADRDDATGVAQPVGHDLTE